MKENFMDHEIRCPHYDKDIHATSVYYRKSGEYAEEIQIESSTLNKDPDAPIRVIRIS